MKPSTDFTDYLSNLWLVSLVDWNVIARSVAQVDLTRARDLLIRIFEHSTHCASQPDVLGIANITGNMSTGNASPGR
jgi:hypothetical protein